MIPEPSTHPPGSADRERIMALSALDELMRQLGALGAERVYLYGSIAKGTARPTSDVDLYVVAPPEAQRKIDSAYWLNYPTVVVEGIARQAHIVTAAVTGTNDAALFCRMQPEARPLRLGKLHPAGDAR